MNIKKFTYLLNSLVNTFNERGCPFCSSKSSKVDDTKYVVTRLLECDNCSLKFRHPLDSLTFNRTFYNSFYSESDGITTDLPSKEKISELKKSNFSGTNKNAHKYIELFQFLFGNKRIRILDFGANWGYTSFQFSNAGYDVVGYEISIPRADYGINNLGVDIKTDLEEINGNFDVIFNSHVIEHLPDINVLIDTAKKRLNENGYLITFCPNGSDEFKKLNYKSFHKCWGLVHPNFISSNFIEKVFKNHPYFIGSGNNISAVKSWNKNSQLKSNIDQWELFSIVKFDKSL